MSVHHFETKTQFCRTPVTFFPKADCYVYGIFHGRFLKIGSSTAPRTRLMDIGYHKADGREWGAA